MGNGPSAATLTDDQNRPILPYNFHDGRRFKCGTTDEDLYRIFMTGLDGTPMPSWSDNIKPDEAWDLVFYLRSLQPMKSKEKELARQIGLKPGAPAPHQRRQRSNDSFEAKKSGHLKEREKQMKARYQVAGMTLNPAAARDRFLVASPECERGRRWQDHRNGQTGWRSPAHEGH